MDYFRIGHHTSESPLANVLNGYDIVLVSESSTEAITQGNPLTVKQRVLIVGVAAILWLPMILFFASYGDRLSERLNAAVAGVNLFLGVGLLILISRKWISKVRKKPRIHS